MINLVGIDPRILRLLELQQVDGAAGATSIQSAVVPNDEIWWIMGCGATHDELAVSHRISISIRTAAAFGIRLAQGSTLGSGGDGVPVLRDFILPPGHTILVVAEALGVGNILSLRALMARLKLPRSPLEFTMPFMLPRGF